MQLWKLGCRWGKGNGMPLFYDFIKENNVVVGWVDKDYNIGDWVLVADGHTILSFAKILTPRKTALDFPQWKDEFEKLKLPYEKNLSVYQVKYIHLKTEDRFLYPLQKGIVKVKGPEYIKTFKKLRTKYMSQYNIASTVNLLRYKKQIIIQGPPGTGKTRLAKEIASAIIKTEIVAAKPLKITSADIENYIKPGDVIKSVSGKATYTVKSVNEINLTIITESGTTYSPSYNNIGNYYQSKNWQNGIIGSLDSYEAAIAKYIYEKIEAIEFSVDLNETEQFVLVQFHPSYSYEDFVRGIEAKPNPEGDGVVYEAKNKVLGKFANAAFDNYKLSRNKVQSKQLLEVKSAFQKFVDHVQDELDKSSDRKYPISEAVYIFDVDDKRFKYKGDNWRAHEKGLNMKFSELEKIIQANIAQRADVKLLTNIEELTKQHATYFFNTLEKYRDFEKLNSTTVSQTEVEQQAREKNYVLVIDEINRANLSSVLGELIYALEYRGETVKSIYDIDNNSDLVLPPNLYIIGTMNTADRSVGHIDYAIRRRFAFVEVLPKDLSAELGDKFSTILFEQVAKLFTDNCSNEFDVKDVQLGHSYFIDKSSEGGSMAIRLQYEIKPILLEYVKDGILVGENIVQKIENLSI